MTRRVEFPAGFDRLFRRLPKGVRPKAYGNLALFLEDPTHPSLRVKRMKGTAAIWELSVTMNYRITFEVDADRVLLRRVGTHDMLRHE